MTDRLPVHAFRIDAVDSSQSPDFGVAYDALASEFGPRGELERRDVLARWVDEDPLMWAGSGLVRSYHLLVARDERGALAGVRDCHVVVDPTHRVAVVYLAHVLVLPAFRRSGLAALFRREPVARARVTMAESGIDPDAAKLLVAAEMDPVSLDDEATLVRLVAYGKDGFSALPPSAVPYCQPDFHAANAALARPLPMLAVVRFVGHEGETTLRRSLARAFVTHLYAVFASHVDASHLATLSAATLRALEQAPDPVPLLPLPKDLGDRTRAEPLTMASILRFYPSQWR